MTAFGNFHSPRLPEVRPTPAAEPDAASGMPAPRSRHPIAERPGPDVPAGAAVWQTAPVVQLPNLQIGVSTHAARAVVRLDGELDVASTDPLAQRLSDLLSQGHTQIVVDLTHLAFCDAAGLRAFARTSRLAKTRRGWLRMAAAQPRMTRIIRIADLSRVLPGYETTQDALAG
jgi:anti-sigma B factor antagonist